MSLFTNKPMGGGFMDVIRCDVPEYLIWKWRPEGMPAGGSRKENGIRWGSRLRVKEGEVAAFVYSRQNGHSQEFVEGPFDATLETRNLPIISRIVGLAYDGNAPFPAEVYFINLARIIQTRFFVPYFDVFDPRFDDFGVPVAVRGTISFSIVDYQEFVELHRLIDFDLSVFRKQISDAVSRYVKSVVSNIPVAYGLPVPQIERKVAEINDLVEAQVKSRLSRDFGVEVSAIDIGDVDVDEASEGYRRLMSVTRDLTEATINTQTEVALTQMRDVQRVEIEDYAERLRIQREEGQYSQHKRTQSVNLPAYQLETQTTIGVAGAKALGEMGARGVGEVTLGSGMGFNPASIMSEMALGEAVGRNVASVMSAAMGGGMMSQSEYVPSTTPPIVNYHVAVEGEPTGPYDLSMLADMARGGTLTGESLVWTRGMASWVRASEIPEVARIINASAEGMPPIPPVS